MLTLIKKHYEKIILTFLLIVFVVLLVIQLSMILEGKVVVTEDLKPLARDPDYKRVNFKDAKFDALLALSDSIKWLKGEPRNPNDKLFTDLCSPLELARCPHCEHLIPAGNFKDGKCSYCGATLKPPPKVVTTKIDTDKDGIPDEDEVRLGLNPKDAKDADDDLDMDGFSNLEEYLAGTDIRNPKSHPSYTEKLFVIEVVRKKLNMKVGNIIAKGDDKSKWMAQIKIFEGGKERTRFVAPGGAIKSDDGEYKLLEIIPKFKTEPDTKLNVTLEKNYSEVILQKTGSEEKLIGEIGKDIVESREKIILLYGITNKKIELYVGDSITLGDERTGIEKYTVTACDPAKTTVTLKKDDDKGTLFELQPRRQSERQPDKDKPQGNLPF